MEKIVHFGHIKAALSVKTLDGFPAQDLTRTQTVKDRTEKECDAGFHQTLEEECRERFPTVDRDKHGQLHAIFLCATNQSFDQKGLIHLFRANTS